MKYLKTLVVPKILRQDQFYLDVSKAFDKVWHEGLIFKPEQNGVTCNLLKLLENYLNDRVVLNGAYSDWGSIKSGVAQGSVPESLLFLVYINDLEKGIKSPIKFFADDTSPFSTVYHLKISAGELNHDLQLISQCAFQWKSSFNRDPTKPVEEIIFSRRLYKQSIRLFFFNNIMVKQVSKHTGE